MSISLLRGAGRVLRLAQEQKRDKVLGQRQGQRKAQEDQVLYDKRLRQLRALKGAGRARAAGAGLKGTGSRSSAALAQSHALERTALAERKGNRTKRLLAQRKAQNARRIAMNKGLSALPQILLRR